MLVLMMPQMIAKTPLITATQPTSGWKRITVEMLAPNALGKITRSTYAMAAFQINGQATERATIIRVGSSVLLRRKRICRRAGGTMMIYNTGTSITRE